MNNGEQTTNNRFEWFEENPTKSIITYTIFIVGVTWGGSYFILDENKVNVIRAEVENEKAITNQYKAKTEVLEDQITQLRNENKKYLEWLSGTPNTIPYLELKINTLNEELHPKKNIGRGNGILEDLQGSGTGKVGVPAYVNAATLNIGEGWVDQNTNLTFGVNQVLQDFTAEALIGIPGQKEQELKQVKPGKSWIFTKGAKQYQFVVKNINWYTNKVEVELREIVDSSKK